MVLSLFAIQWLTYVLSFINNVTVFISLVQIISTTLWTLIYSTAVFSNTFYMTEQHFEAGTSKMNGHFVKKVWTARENLWTAGLRPFFD